MTTQEYDRLKDAAVRRAHFLRHQALHDFCTALVRRLARFVKQGA